MEDLLARTEARRRAALASLDPKTQAEMGQFFTPERAATLLASLPTLEGLNGRHLRVLDPGAGSGSLTAALASRLSVECPLSTVHVVAVEADTAVVPYLEATLAEVETIAGFSTELVVGDYIIGSTGLNRDQRMAGPFDLVVMNPPYGKMAAADSKRRAVARELVDCPNVYAAFWALGVASLGSGGQCTAIVPRSWANGVYFESFRHWLLDQFGLDTLHVFESRSSVFKDTGVLQENVIVSGTRGTRRGSVTLSTSVGHDDEVTRQTVSSAVVVRSDDPHSFVRFTDGAAAVPAAARFTLADLGLSVSTGRVVDFRSRAWLSHDADEGDTAPLVYPGNVRGGGVQWPRPIGKPQAFRTSDAAARKMLVPAGCYTLVKRFSAKEERRRVVAGVWTSEKAPAFENHLNYFHEGGHGLVPDLAHGLSAWLNSTALDELFRTFSGHTQVNAGDLRSLPFPSRNALMALGRELPVTLPGQEELDALIFEVLDGLGAVA